MEIIIDEHSKRSIKLAAKELSSHLFKITGKEIPIRFEPVEQYQFFVGKSKYLSKKIKINTSELKDGSFQIISKRNWTALVGDDEDFVLKEPYGHSRADVTRVIQEWDNITQYHWDNPFTQLFKAYNKELDVWEYDRCGSLNAVYEFLRMQGFEWYLPGDIGEIIPDRKDIFLPELDLVFNPDFLVRNFYFQGKRFFQSSKEEVLWQLKLGINRGGDLLGVNGLGHGTKHVHAREEVKKAHPNYFGMYEGKRDITYRKTGKPCLSSRGLLEQNIKYAQKIFDWYDIPVVSVMPQDGYGYMCQCHLCFGKGTPERGFKGKMSDYVWSYVNEVAKELYKSHPHKKVICYAYGSYLLPPEKIDRLSPNIQVGICRWRTDLKSPNEYKFYKNLQKSWLAKSNNRPLIFWDYYLHSRKGKSFEGIPVVFTDLIKDDLQNIKGKSWGEIIEISRNLQGTEIFDLAVNHINVYITSRLYWDVDQDLEVLLNRYYNDFYGPAADELRAFFELSQNNWNIIPEQPHLIDALFQQLELGLKKTEKEIFRQRIQLIYDFIQPLKERKKILQVPREYSKVIKVNGKNTSQLQIDGRLNETLWQGIPVYKLLSKNKKELAQKTHYRTIWGDGFITFGFEIKKNKSYRNQTKDFIELLIEDNASDGSFYRIMIDLINQKVIIFDDQNYRVNADNMISFVFQNNQSNISLELKINIDSSLSIKKKKPTKLYPWYFNMRRIFTEGNSENFELLINPESTLDFYNPKGFSIFFVK